MKKSITHIILATVLTAFVSIMWAEGTRVAFHCGKTQYVFPADSIDSVCFDKALHTVVYLNGSSSLLLQEVDSITFDRTLCADTLYVTYSGGLAEVINPWKDEVIVCVDGADVQLEIGEGCSNAVICVNGSTADGCLCLSSETDCKVVLDDVSLSCSHGPAMQVLTKQKTTVILPEGTCNYMNDAPYYQPTDAIESANGCLCTRGALVLEGGGRLTVTGKKKHAISARKSITLKSGYLTVEGAVSDAIHSGKNVRVQGGTISLRAMHGDGIDADEDFFIEDGNISMQVAGDGAKGIKCGEEMRIDGGSVLATAVGGLKIEGGELTYCTLLKCDSSMTMTSGELNLCNESPGGKCISVGRNMTMSGGRLQLSTSGDGDEYTDGQGMSDYYTSKCIAVDDTLRLERGDIHCLSTGVGGKGIVAGRNMEIGLPADSSCKEGPTVTVQTTSHSIVDDVEEDQRYGCPKAIKSAGNMCINSGEIQVFTAGMGGEGVECAREMSFCGGSLECNCFDDGINVGERLEIFGGQIYCNSSDNDGIDSNGCIYIRGGVVAAINQLKPNESLDSESGQLYFSGGLLLCIGSCQVKVGDSSVPYYNTVKNRNPELGILTNGLLLHPGQYLSIEHGGKVICALKNENLEYRSYVTFTHPNPSHGNYNILLGNAPYSPEQSLFDGKLLIGGLLSETEYIESFTLIQ